MSGLFKNDKTSFSTISHYFNKDEIAYRYPEQNFKSGSILFVQPGQEAVLIKEGDPDGPYTNGRYTLDTNQLPRLSKFFRRGYDGDVFNCYLYFVNKDKPVNVLWGTNHQIKVRDPHTGRIVRMFGRGSLALTISDSVKFIAKTNGQLSSYTAEDVDEFLFGKSIETIISNLSQSLQQERISFVEIESHLNVISSRIKAQLIDSKLFETYGLKLSEFSVTTIDINDEDFKAIQAEENDLEKRRREVELQAMEIRAKGFAESDVMKEKGVYYDKERSYDVLQAAAQNEGGLGGGFVGAGVGLGVGLGAGAGFGSAIGQLASNAFTPASQEYATESIICQACKSSNKAGAKFCSGCGASLASNIVICASCGAKNYTHAKFCSECGNKIDTVKKICSECGAENDVKTKFCSECGSRFEQIQ